MTDAAEESAELRAMPIITEFSAAVKILRRYMLPTHLMSAA